jgi:hypothetical protein
VLKLGFVLLVLLSTESLSSLEESSIQQAAESGRALLPDAPDVRLSPAPSIAPGQPPLLSFRYYEGKSHHRFGNAELMLDDAGH